MQLLLHCSADREGGCGSPASGYAFQFLRPMVLRAEETDVFPDSERLFENDDPGVKECGISKFSQSARGRQFSLCLCVCVQHSNGAMKGKRVKSTAGCYRTNGGQ